METNIDDQSTWSRLVAHWQPAVLVTACVAGGLTLTMMVIGSTPDVLQASQAAIEAAPVDALASGESVFTEVPVDTAATIESTESTESTELVEPVADGAAVGAGAGLAAPSEPATVAAPAPRWEPLVPSAAPAATPAAAPAAAPSAPAPPATAATPAVTSGPLAPVTAAAPQTTAAPTTAAPAPNIAVPVPTTAPPVPASLTYPSFSAGSAATVVLQFDGSSIYVASVAREANWVAQVDKNGPRTVEIKFFNTATQRDEEFHATVESGRIKVEN